MGRLSIAEQGWNRATAFGLWSSGTYHGERWRRGIFSSAGEVEISVPPVVQSDVLAGAEVEILR